MKEHCPQSMRNDLEREYPLDDVLKHVDRVNVFRFIYFTMHELDEKIWGEIGKYDNALLELYFSKIFRKYLFFYRYSPSTNQTKVARNIALPGNVNEFNMGNSHKDEEQSIVCIKLGELTNDSLISEAITNQTEISELVDDIIAGLPKFEHRHEAVRKNGGSERDQVKETINQNQVVCIYVDAFRNNCKNRWHDEDIARELMKLAPKLPRSILGCALRNTVPSIGTARKYARRLLVDKKNNLLS